MEHYFELPVTYDGHDQLFKGRLVTFGYDYKFYIVVEGEEIVFEKDDQGDFRAVGNSTITSPKINVHLLEAIVQSLQQLSLH